MWRSQDPQPGQGDGLAPGMWCAALLWGVEDSRTQALAHNVISQIQDKIPDGDVFAGLARAGNLEPGFNLAASLGDVWQTRIDQRIYQQVALRITDVHLDPTRLAQRLVAEYKGQRRAPWAWWRAGPMADRFGPYNAFALIIQALAPTQRQIKMAAIGIPD